MPKYIVLANWTDQGIRTVKDSPKRLDETRKALEAAGCKLLDFYLTMGNYDEVLIVEAPSDEVAATMAISSGSQGNTRTVTLKAFSEDEYRKIIGNIP